MVDEFIEPVSFSELVRKHRKEKNITTTELAKMVGVSQGTISNLERGKNVSDKVVDKVIKVLEIPISDINYEEVKNNTVLPGYAENIGKATLTMPLTNSKIKVTIESTPSDEIKNLDQHAALFMQFRHLTMNPLIIESIFQLIEDNIWDIEAQAQAKVINQLEKRKEEKKRINKESD